MLYAKSMRHIKQLIGLLDVKLQIRHNKYGPKGCYYDPDKLTIHVNTYNVRGTDPVSLLVHQYAHRLQHFSGYFDNNHKLSVGQNLYDLISHGKMTYNSKKHKKYLNRLLKMQYDGRYIATYVINCSDVLRQYLNQQDYMRDMNFYMMSIKYTFNTGKKLAYTRDDVRQCTLIDGNKMSYRKLFTPLSKKQTRYLENIK